MRRGRGDTSFGTDERRYNGCSEQRAVESFETGKVKFLRRSAAMGLPRGQNAPRKYDVLVGAWKRFADWGEVLCKGSSQTSGFDEASTDWGPVRRFLGAFAQLTHHEAARLGNLLEQCDARLHPLADPLRLTLEDHRWFDPERGREEDYSDWLCWLLAHLDSTEQILSVFALEGTEFGSAVRTRRALSIGREECVPVLNGGKKRLDLVVRFDEGYMLLVEVKIQSLDRAGGRDNLPLYLEWLEGKQPDPQSRNAVLLLQNQDESVPAGWTTRFWDDIALALRRLARGLRNAKPAGLMRSAMMLAFAGAVEQNLLGLSGSTSGASAPQTTLYLERFLQEH
jgi:hypothetical protein